MMQCALFHCDLHKQKISTWCFRFFVNIGTLGCFEFAQLKASVELCFNKLSDAAAKFEVKKLIGKSLIVN